MDKEELKNRTKQFAHRCIRVATKLPATRLGRHIESQMIRSATSVAANYRAVCLAHSKASFVAKLSIVIEELDETYFWMELIVDENLIKKELLTPLMSEADELLRIFIASRKTIQTRKTIETRKSNNK